MVLAAAAALDFLQAAVSVCLEKGPTVLLASMAVVAVLAVHLVQLTLPLTLPPLTVGIMAAVAAVWITVVVVLQLGLKTAASAQLESSGLAQPEVFHPLIRGTYNESLYPHKKWRAV
jgi:hypothetical protein